MAAQSQPVSADASTITYPRVERALGDRVRWFYLREHSLTHFAQASIKARAIPDLGVRDGKFHKQLDEVREFLDLLEFDTDMTPRLRNSTKIEGALELVNRNGVYFPGDIKERAEMLLQRFRDANWGAGAAAQDDEDSDPGDDEAATSPTTAAAPATTGSSTGSGRVSVISPPADHAIWGLNGIMHGIAVKQVSKRYQIDPRYRYKKRSANLHGHNGLTLGAWFPRQICALFHGAHGSLQAGIYGSKEGGTYSIIVSGTYAAVDEDRGDSLWYSVPGAVKNKNKNEVSDSPGAAALMRSLTTRGPVRVLRGPKKSSAYAPSVGFRYDGLYEIVRRDTSHHNSDGGLVVRFLLVRLPGQTSLEDIRHASPTAQEMADEGRIKDLW